MKALFAGLLKTAFSIALLAIAFWPNIGVAYYIYDNFYAMPSTWIVVVALWMGLLALNLPLSLNTFRRMTTLSILAMFGASIYALWQAGKFNLASWETWLVTGIVMLGTIIGWWTSSVPLWRWYRHTLAMDDESGLSE